MMTSRTVSVLMDSLRTQIGWRNPTAGKRRRPGSYSVGFGCSAARDHVRRPGAGPAAGAPAYDDDLGGGPGLEVDQQGLAAVDGRSRQSDDPAAGRLAGAL